MINNILCEKILGRKIDKDFEFDNLGLINTTLKNSLVFLDEEKYVNQLVKNENISGVIAETWLIEKLPLKLHVTLILKALSFFPSCHQFQLLKL